MKKHKLLPLLSILLLTSCNTNIPEEILNYFNSVSFSKGYAYVLNATLVAKSIQYDVDEQGNKTSTILGQSDITYVMDKSNTKDFYTYLDSSFSGTFVTSAPDANGETVEDVLTRKCVRYLKTDDGTYDTKFIINGSESTRNISNESMLASINSFFYAEIVSQSIYTGGMYYADTMNQIKRFSEYLSVDEDGNLHYDVKNQAQVNEENEEIFDMYYDIDLITNKYGMLASRYSTSTVLKHLEGNNYDATSIIEQSLEIEYNKESIERTKF